MLSEFKKFIAKGNVMELAVAVIIGGAFATIVSSMTDDLIMPIVGMIFGDVDFSDKYLVLSSDSDVTGMSSRRRAKRVPMSSPGAALSRQ